VDILEYCASEFKEVRASLARIEDKVGSKVDAVEVKVNGRVDGVEERLRTVEGRQKKLIGAISIIGALFTLAIGILRIRYGG
jgi:tetrahydromethanopterin S-methyltransferase subunit G